MIVVQYLMSNFSAILCREQSTFWWEDDDCGVPDYHTDLDFHQASLMKQQYASRYVNPLRHIVSITSQSDFALNS